MSGCYCVSFTRMDLDMENTSTSYLQQLLGSFPSMDTNGDKKQDGGESSDGEYQIYEQDDDENYLDDDDDWPNLQCTMWICLALFPLIYLHSLKLHHFDLYAFGLWC